MPLQTSPESPAPLRVVSQMVGDWIARLGSIWVEGQITQISRRAGMQLTFLTLRDLEADVSVTVTCRTSLLDTVEMTEGSRVVILARPAFYAGRGTLSLFAQEIRLAGLGDLLAQLEKLKRLLSAEGLFDPARKRPLPFLPRTVGLVCGRGSAAERDVVENAQRRWPAVRFEIAEVAVQGTHAVAEVIDALSRLDADPQVDVIVIARGGGSLEDLLPFSNEALVRAVAAARTPVVSAIGHEVDFPLLDFVADVRASTPTDAAKRIVPDRAEEVATIAALSARGRRVVERIVERDRERVEHLNQSAHRAVRSRLAQESTRLQHLRAQLLAMSPQATLERGYAVVQRRADGHVLRRPADAPPGTALNITLAEGVLLVPEEG